MSSILGCPCAQSLRHGTFFKKVPCQGDWKKGTVAPVIATTRYLFLLVPCRCNYPKKVRCMKKGTVSPTPRKRGFVNDGDTVPFLQSEEKRYRVGKRTPFRGKGTVAPRLPPQLAYPGTFFSRRPVSAMCLPRYPFCGAPRAPKRVPCRDSWEPSFSRHAHHGTFFFQYAYHGTLFPIRLPRYLSKRVPWYAC